MNKNYDIVIIGGGAAGMAAAVSASNELKALGKQASVAVLEGSKKLGRKLLATGNGRCNLTNMNISPAHYFGDVRFASKIFEEFTPDRIISFFESVGLVCAPDSEGRVYPYNKQAAAVLEMLHSTAEHRGVEFITEFNVTSVEKNGKLFSVISESGEIKAKKLMIATGGKASPKLLCNTNGYDLASSVGHSVTKLYPALLQLRSGDKFLKNLSGMRCKAEVSLMADGDELRRESGELLFADKALSGICVFGLSLYAGEFFATGKIAGKTYKTLSLKADLAPDFTSGQVQEYIESRITASPESPAGDILAGLLNMKVGREIVRSCGIDTLAPAKVAAGKVNRLVKNVKALTLPISGIKDFEDAQITAGGIPLNEININTMESRVAQNLYLAGELLNIHGECGGYNLHWAWATGIRAGAAAARSLKGK